MNPPSAHHERRRQCAEGSDEVDRADAIAGIEDLRDRGGDVAVDPKSYHSMKLPIAVPLIDRRIVAGSDTLMSLRAHFRRRGRLTPPARGAVLIVK